MSYPIHCSKPGCTSKQPPERMRRVGDSYVCKGHDLTPARLKVLRAIAAGFKVNVQPIQMAWFRREGYLEWAEPPHAPMERTPLVNRDFKSRAIRLTPIGLAACSGSGDSVASQP